MAVVQVAYGPARCFWEGGARCFVEGFCLDATMVSEPGESSAIGGLEHHFPKRRPCDLVRLTLLLGQTTNPQSQKASGSGDGLWL